MDQSDWPDDSALFVAHCIAHHGRNREIHGPGNFLCVCLEALTLLEMDEERFFDTRNKVKSRFANTLDLEPRLAETLEVTQEWTSLSSHLESSKYLHSQLSGFVSENPEMTGGGERCGLILSKCKPYIEKLKDLETYLNENIDKRTSIVTARMAELSIKESKRVMLCMSNPGFLVISTWAGFTDLTPLSFSDIPGFYFPPNISNWYSFWNERPTDQPNRS